MRPVGNSDTLRERGRVLMSVVLPKVHVEYGVNVSRLVSILVKTGHPIPIYRCDRRKEINNFFASVS
jgi:hypothetical protein